MNEVAADVAKQIVTNIVVMKHDDTAYNMVVLLRFSFFIK
jgi:hypothetical protein